MELVRIKALTKDGGVLWHTGRAGSEWVSADEREAARLFSLEGARRFAARANLNEPLHGLRFVAEAA